MRKFSFVAAALLLSAASAYADTQRAMVCREYAKVGADVWADGRLSSADTMQTANPQQVVVVMGAKKFVAPLHPQGVVLQSLGGIMADRGTIYNEEFSRCMNSHSLSVAVQD